MPGRPMLPVMSASAMIACAVRTPSWLWFTPIVHHKLTRLPLWMSVAKLVDAIGRDPGGLFDIGRGKRCNMRRKFIEAVGVRFDVRAIDPPSLDEDPSDRVEQREVALGRTA